MQFTSAVGFSVSSLFLGLLVAAAVACNPPIAPERLQPPPGPATYAVTVRQPTVLRGAITLPTTAQEMRVACDSCHSLRAVAPLPASTAELDEFHVGLEVRHGELACASCHAAGQVPRLHLATGETLALRDTIQLCAQCHGPQWRDYQHGAHGGMSGHWDLSRGPRTRNHCIDCHDPHAPKYVGGDPVLPPRDRGLPAPAREGAHR